MVVAPGNWESDKCTSGGVMIAVKKDVAPVVAKWNALLGNEEELRRSG